MEDRRKYPRYDLSHKGICDDMSQAVLDEGFETENVSRGGLRIKHKALIPEGRIFCVKIYNPIYDTPLDASARVIWSRKTEDGTVISGLAFTRVGWIECDKLFVPEVVACE